MHGCNEDGKRSPGRGIVMELLESCITSSTRSGSREANKRGKCKTLRRDRRRWTTSAGRRRLKDFAVGSVDRRELGVAALRSWKRSLYLGSTGHDRTPMILSLKSRISHRQHQLPEFLGVDR
ncbi:hypothetical protein MUK42_04686 [Musa troglodytarum]|uniref:Uncharacterized protein n=1 Tax=Musa troglodytarum TaxID=320322 RepID=A0A9E7G026_9LILI|nr:hypothetical protein MUK42_04686 [Musa troglodytarum]